LYLYNIKIQTDIDQNAVKNLWKIIDFFEIIFEYFFRAGPSPAHVAELDPAGFYPQACVNNSRTPATVTM
jgi:hypothetical protein